MIKHNSFIKILIHSVFGAAILASTVPASAGLNTPSQLPLFVSKSVPPLNMLVLGKDHKLFGAAYNDASDLNGDNVLDTHYTPTINYYGYFDSNKCYDYSSNVFVPAATTANKKCDGTKWSGDFLNYVTTSRIDALRKVLYGGNRSTDDAFSVSQKTMLERAYIPQDAHSWGKEYLSVERDGYDIHDYTPLSAINGNYILFANTTPSTGETSITAWRNPNGAPLMRVINGTTHRIWEWVATEAPVAGKCDICTPLTDYIVRVQVCKTGLLEDNCKRYPDGGYKPTGLLHDYGAGDEMYFGLMTGSYRNARTGGVLRKVLASFSNEVTAASGQFNGSGIVKTLSALKIQDFNGPGTYAHGYRCNQGWGGPNDTNNYNSCELWGNPLGEVMYETLRYFAGEASATTDYTYASDGTSSDEKLGLPLATWDNPYRAESSGGAPSCAKPFQTVISDINPSFDGELPGGQFGGTLPTPPTSLTGLNVNTLGQTMWTHEFGGDKNAYIGQVGTNNNGAPTAKTVSSFGNIRGLAPEEPSRQGTYYSAMVAYFANKTNLSSSADINRKVKTFAIALSSPIPKFAIPVNDKVITLIPFAKVVKGPIGNSDTWQPTSQIVGFFIQSMYNMPGQITDNSQNGGRPTATFRINFEDAEQGGDHDMDEIVRYDVAVTAAGTLSVTLTTEYASAGHESHLGYVISGTQGLDGVYLDVTGGGSGNTLFKFDTPPGRNANECYSTALAGTCTGYKLPGLPTGRGVTTTGPTRLFTPSTSSSSALSLNNPLWFAAKYGGFKDANANNLPDPGEWDSKVTGTPDNYFLVTNALNLKAQLDQAFKSIAQSNNSVTSVAATTVSNSSADSNRAIYRTDYKVATWSGDLIKETTNVVTSAVTAEWKASANLPTIRNIKMANATGNSLIDFTWANLNTRVYATANLQKALATDPATNLASVDASGNLTAAGITAGQKRLAFIKGTDTSYRTRTSLLGDIINSSPAVVQGAQYLAYLAEAIDDDATHQYTAFISAQAARSPRVYVGANDGMLHAFNATTGAETFAFVPTAVIANLNKYTASNYNSDGSQHQYYVDGSPVVRDVYFSGAWHTVLVGTLRAGGRSMFALDITVPDTPTLLWEFSEDSLASIDNTVDPANTLSDLGYTFATPTIARLHNGKWAVVTGNGYDSPSGRATLFLLDISDGSLIRNIPVGAAGSGNNGLSSVGVADINSDGFADYAYAGDLLGNMWRFDLIDSASTPPLAKSNVIANDKFKLSYGNAPLYSAKDATTSPVAAGQPQPITTAPTFVRHPSLTGYIVIFGTGKYYAPADKLSPSNAMLQNVYGIWDKQTKGQTTTAPTALTRSDLQAQTITSQTNSAVFTNPAASTTATRDIRLFSDNTVNWASKSGWYLDLAVNASVLGERVTDNPILAGQTLYVPTRTSSADVCLAGLEGWVYGVNPLTGGRTKHSPFDYSHDGIINANDRYSASGSSNIATGIKTPVGGITLTGGVTPAIVDSNGNPIAAGLGPNATGRQTWHVIPQD